MKIKTIEQANIISDDSLFFYRVYIIEKSITIGQRELCRRLGVSESLINKKLKRNEFSSLKKLANQIHNIGINNENK